MKDAIEMEAAKERAAAKVRKQQDKAVEAQAAWQQAEAIKVAETEKTAKLKALRLAKEQAEREAEAAKPPKPKRARAVRKTVAAVTG